MKREQLEAYIHKRLKELDAGKDMQDVIYKGKFSFGMSSADYKHLPAWKTLVKESKNLKKIFWVDAYFTALGALVISNNYFERFVWWKASLALIVVSGIVMLVSTAVFYHSFFIRTRRTEKEVRKLIYQDILDKLKKEENIAV